MTQRELEEWVASSNWRFARTMARNPHEYLLKRDADPETFERVVEHIRQFGYECKYGRWVYIQLDIADHFFWTIGSPAECTILINRKCRDPEEQARLAEAQTGKSREELGLQMETLRRTGRVEEGSLDRAAQLKLSNIDQKEDA